MMNEQYPLPTGEGTLNTGGGAGDDLPRHLDRFLQTRAAIYYNTGVSDIGRITYLDNHWVELTKDNNEVLLAPVTGLRLIKLLETPRQNDAAATLLRASGESTMKE